MFSKSTTTKQPEEKFIVKQNEHSLYYELNNHNELKAVEISSDLYRVIFYFKESGQEKGRDELDEKRKDIRKKVLFAVSPSLPEIGHLSYTKECVEVFGMTDYLSMHKYNKKHVAENFDISEHLHSLEWVLINAKDAGILSNSLYERIRIDVRHRTSQLQAVAKANQNTYQQVLDEVRKKYSPDANFKRITTASDTVPFAGQVVAYVSHLYYFSNGDNAITLPTKLSGNMIRFAKVEEDIIGWERGEKGYNMECFLTPTAPGSTHALIDSQIKKDSALAMRLATVQELEFLKLTIELDQGRLNYREKESDVKMLGEKITQASGILGRLLPVRSGFFTARNSAVIPPFTSLTSGVVDWTRGEKNSKREFNF